jgi:hypothetical protein
MRQTTSVNPCVAAPCLQCFLSAGDKQLAIIFHLPKALSESKGVTLKEWSAAVLAPVEGHQVEGLGRFSTQRQQQRDSCNARRPAASCLLPAGAHVSQLWLY